MYHLCILTSHFYPVKSSCSNLFKDLINSVLKDDFKITIMTISGTKNKIKVIKTKKITYIGVKNKYLQSSKNYFRAVGDIYAIFRLTNFYNKKNFTEFDQVIVYSPSIFWAILLLKLKKKLVSIKLGDLYPLWLVDHKIIKKYSLSYFFLKFFELFLYYQADKVFVQTEKDIKYISKYKKFFHFDCQVIYNWINTDRLKNIEIKRIKKKYVRFIFIGVIGIAQDFELIFKIIKYCNQNNFKSTFFFIGSGTKKNSLRDLTKDFKNVFFYSEMNLTRLDKIIQQCDVCISTLSKNFYSENFPGRILRYMIFNKPLLVHSPNNNFLKNLIVNNSLGLYSSNEIELFNNIQYIFSKHEIYKEMGSKGFDTVKNLFSCDKAKKKFFV
jgi:glycosyltransferase involved in cell wall biosynthesis